MGLFDFWTKKDGSSLTDTGWVNLGFGQTVAGVSVNQLSAMQNSVVLACVTILASDIAKLPLRLYKKLPGGDKRLAKDHPVAKLFRNPNDFQTRFEWLEHTVVNLLLMGNSYSAILRDQRGVPTALIPLNSQHVQIFESPETTDYFYFVTRSGYHETALLKDFPTTTRGTEKGLMTPSRHMLHIRWLSYINSLRGSDRITLAKEAIGLTMALEESAARLMGSGARPSGMLTTPKKLTKETRDRIAASWTESHSGSKKSGGTAVLEEDLKWMALSFNSVDSQFIEQRRFQVEEIGRIFRVPLYKLNITGDEPGSALLELEQDYINGTLSSYCDRIIGKLYQAFDIDEDEYEISFDYEAALKADIKTRIDNLRIGILAGLFTINEARISLGLPPVANGDIILQPVNVMPLGSTPPNKAGAPGSDTTGKPGAGGDGDAPKANPDTNPSDEAPNS